VDNTCVVIADSGRARIFIVEEGAAPRAPFRLVERDTLANPDLRTRGRSTTGRPRTETNTNREAGPVHPIGAQRERHRLDLERRFAVRIAAHAAGVVSAWPRGAVVLVAGPRMLGLLRGVVRASLRPEIRLKELAKDYAGLTIEELQRHPVVNSLLPKADFNC